MKDFLSEGSASLSFPMLYETNTSWSIARHRRQHSRANKHRLLWLRDSKISSYQTSETAFANHRVFLDHIVLVEMDVRIRGSLAEPALEELFLGGCELQDLRATQLYRRSQLKGQPCGVAVGSQCYLVYLLRRHR